MEHKVRRRRRISDAVKNLPRRATTEEMEISEEIRGLLDKDINDIIGGIKDKMGEYILHSINNAMTPHRKVIEIHNAVSRYLNVVFSEADTKLFADGLRQAVMALNYRYKDNQIKISVDMVDNVVTGIRFMDEYGKVMYLIFKKIRGKYVSKSDI